MKLLSMILIIAVSYTSLAQEVDENKERGKRLKQGLVLGGVIIGGVVGWRVLRHLDYKAFDFLIKVQEKAARRSRMPLSEFTKIEITDPPLYRLTAPDGSQHHILGTMHVSNLSLSDLSADSKLRPILEQADILMPELAEARYTSVMSYAFRSNFRLQLVEQRSLSQQLGEQHWQKLSQMIAEKGDLKPFEQSLDEFMEEIDGLTVDEAYSRLIGYGQAYASPLEGLKMDFQLIHYGREHDKTLIGLESFKQGSSAALKVMGSSHAKIDDLKKLIDKGGIDYVVDTFKNSIRHYAGGNIDESYKGIDALTPPGAKAAINDFLLDQRNVAWVESGKIQKNCVNGNRCLIFVGFGHLVKGDKTLIKLLEKQGYLIERL